MAITMEEIIEAFGHKPDDFVCIETDTYQDVNNDQDYLRSRERVYIPKHIEQEVAYVNVGYEPSDIKFYNKKDEIILESAIPSTFQKHGRVNAFFVNDFGIKES